MALRWPWLAAALGFVAVATVVLRWWLAGRRPATPPDALLAANTARLRQTARFRQVAARQLRWQGVQLACLVLAVGSGAWLAARPQATTVTRPETRNRDIVLCLDVSGSMSDVDALVLEAYATLAASFQKERVALVIWDSAAVTVFPLTTDSAFVVAELHRAAEAFKLHDYRYRAGTQEGVGSSLIGEGLMSCLDRFDQRDVDRPRTVVLATDNRLSGESLFSLPEATDVAVQRKVLVYGIAPTGYDSKELREMREQCRRTGGDVLELGFTERDSSKITQAVQQQEAKLFKSAPIRTAHDLPLVPALVLAAATLGALLAGWRVRS